MRPEPSPALTESLRVSINAADRAQRAAQVHQVVNDGHGHFANNRERTLKQQIECVSYRAVRIVFNGDQTVVHLAALDTVEHFIEVDLRQRFGFAAEKASDGLLGECAGRPEIRHAFVSETFHGDLRSPS